jgi:ABC-2 type transport system ATP-binding protein
VVLCTHQLDEAERLCDQVAFIKKRVLAVETIAHRRPTTVVTLAGEAAPLAATVAAIAGVEDGSVSVEGKRLLFRAEEPIHPEVVRALVAAGAQIVYVAPQRGSLEQLYFKLLPPEHP